MGGQSLAIYLSKEKRSQIANQRQDHCKLTAKAIMPNEK
jgi:hypothetical protein